MGVRSLGLRIMHVQTAKYYLILSLFLAMATSNVARAIEPTPPILFLEQAEDQRFIPLVLDPGKVTDIELSAIIFRDGEVVAEERLNYDEYEIRSLDAFPVPYEEFHVKEQKENAGAERPSRKPALQREIKRAPALEPLRESQIDRRQLMDTLRGGVDVIRPKADVGEKPIAFLVPIELESLRKQEDGYYAVSYLASASRVDDPNAKRIEAQMWGRYQLQRGTVRTLTLEQYSNAVDPAVRSVDRATGEAVLIHVGRSGAEEISLDKTEKFQAIPIELLSGAEQADTGDDSDRAEEQSEKNER